MSAPEADPDLVNWTADLVRRAGELTLRWFRSNELGLETKFDGSPVTAADKATERFIREEIHARFPGDAILGEEEGHAEGHSGRRWIVDPIDGTRAFTRGVGTYSVMLCFEDDHGPAVGAIGVPALGEVVAAGRGRGATLNGRPCRVSEVDDLSEAYLSTSGFNHWDPDMLASAHRSAVRLRTWGDGYGYALVASGRIEAMIDPDISLWDIAPCRVIVPEAGGRFTTIEGHEAAEPADALATNALLHERIVELLNGRGG